MQGSPHAGIRLGVTQEDLGSQSPGSRGPPFADAVDDVIDVPCPVKDLQAANDTMRLILASLVGRKCLKRLRFRTSFAAMNA
jgi:hypothetical protein